MIEQGTTVAARIGTCWRTGTIINIFSDIRERVTVYVVKSLVSDFRMAHRAREIVGIKTPQGWRRIG